MLLSLLAAWVSFATALFCVHAAARAARLTRIAQARAAEAYQQAADEETRTASALQLLVEEQRGRADDQAHYAARLAALHHTYDLALQEYRDIVQQYRRVLGEIADDAPTTH